MWWLTWSACADLDGMAPGVIDAGALARVAPVGEWVQDCELLRDAPTAASRPTGA